MEKICDCCKTTNFCLQHKITEEWYCSTCFKRINEIINKINSKSSPNSSSKKDCLNELEEVNKLIKEAKNILKESLKSKRSPS